MPVNFFLFLFFNIHSAGWLSIEDMLIYIYIYIPDSQCERTAELIDCVL